MTVKFIDGVLQRLRTVYVCPEGSDPFATQNMADVIPFGQPHVVPRFVFGDLDTRPTEYVFEGSYRSQATEIDSGSSPIKYDAYQPVDGSKTDRRFLI